MLLGPGFFLTGTDTGVGKTRVACALVRGWRREGLDCVGLKPLACGDRDDAVALREAADRVLPLDEVNPEFFATPAAPYAASLVEGRSVDLKKLYATIELVRRKHESVIVEGLGGWRVPISRTYSLGDLAAELALPVLVVAANRLGVINHTCLTVEAILQGGLVCAGVILNDLGAAGEGSSWLATSNRRLLEELLPVPILGTLPYGGCDVQWQLLQSKTL